MREEGAGGAAADPSALSSGPFELIVANIIAKVHVALGRDYVGALTPGGLLIVSGIIMEREADVVGAFAQAGLQPVERRQEGDWVALVYRRP